MKRFIAALLGTVFLSSVVAQAQSMVQLATTDATLSAKPSNPTGTTATGGAMMGLGSTCRITTVHATRLLISLYGIGLNSISTDGFLVQLKVGTGTAPSNGDTSNPGTAVGQTVGTKIVFSNGAYSAFGITDIMTGITPRTAYWIDAQVSEVGGVGTAAIANVGCAAQAF